MFKATPGVHRSLRHIAEEKNSPASFDQIPGLKGAESVGTMPGQGDSTTLAHYKDTAEQAKPNHPTGGMTAFNVKGK